MSVAYAIILAYTNERQKMLKEKITVGEAVNLINESILNFQEGLSAETISKITYAVNNELQVRDYLIGLPLTYSLDTCKSFMTYLTESAEESQRYSFLTVNALYYYEAEETDVATLMIILALNIDEDYPLAKLVEKVIMAGWATDSITAMRNELHPIVVAKLTEMKEELI